MMKKEDAHLIPPPDRDSASSSASQRQQAEARLKDNAVLAREGSTLPSSDAIRHLLHELRVHQIELQMQNETLRESQIALDAARERYFDLYDLAPVGYLTINEQGLILQCNLSAAKLFSMPRETLLAQPLTRRICKDDQDGYYFHRKRLLETGAPQALELRMLKAGGSEFWAHLTATCGLDAEGAREIRMVLVDITERVMLHQALLGKNVELERAKLVAERANQAKSGFLSSMSHEIRTPLHAILGFAQLMQSSAPPPDSEQIQNIDQILKAAWHLLELINEVLNLAAIEAGKPALKMESVSLAEMMCECRAMVEPMARDRGVDVFFPSSEMSHCVRVDRIRLRQTLLNLLSNAIKYNRKDGTVTITCEATAEDLVRVSVEDTGAGLSPEKLDQLFQPFNRLGQDNEIEEGTGIGLVVCKRLVELMGGTIGVESTPGKGSVFWMELNLSGEHQIAFPAAEPFTRPSIERIEQKDNQICTLLYVEDNPANLMLIQAIIARQPNIRLLTAENGMQGIEMAREFLPDLVMMDIDLPDISGIEALKMLVEDSATSHIPVIALSANAMPAEVEHGLKVGFSRYLTKPIKIDEFLKILQLEM
jgi:PAS domain S-box-containing protein